VKHLNQHNCKLSYEKLQQMCESRHCHFETISGESILICEPKTQRRALGLIQASLPPVSSALLGANGSVSMSMKRALLEVIASKGPTTFHPICFVFLFQIN